MKKMTHAQLDKMWKKLTKEWKIKALGLIKDEQEIMELMRKIQRQREKATKGNK